MLEGYYWDMVNQASTNFGRRKNQMNFNRFVCGFVAGVWNDGIAGEANNVAAFR